jgi:hypothetical protein
MTAAAVCLPDVLVPVTCGADAMSREQVLERALRSVLTGGACGEDDGLWVGGQRCTDAGTSARIFRRAPGLKPWDQLGLDL